MVETGQFLFGIPNSISKLYSNKLYLYGWLTVIMGILSLANASIATGLEGVKSYYITQYVNTHWITSIFVISGGTTILVERLHIDFFLFTAICTNLIALFTAIGAVIFDCANLHTVSRIDRGSDSVRATSDNIQTRAMIAYSVIDIICCSAAFTFSLLTCLEMRSISKRYFSNLHGFRSKFLLCCGFCLCAVGVAKQILWICELRWLIRLGEVGRFLFLNYTMDEPVWNCIYFLTGILNCWSGWKGGRTIAYCALPLTALSAYPVIQYLWIDYRWLLSIQLTEVMIEVPKPERLLHANISITAAHLILIIVTVVQLCRLFSKHGLPWTVQPLVLDSDVRKTILCIGGLLLFAGCAFFITDVVNIQAATFYRLFYPTEQKLPFFLIPAGVLCMIILRNQTVGPYFIPCLLILLLLIFHATMFQIFTYVYLTTKLYFNAHLCDLFFYTKFKCSARVERIGAVAHFMEASLAVTIMALALYGSMLFGRMLSFYALPQADQLTADEQHSKKRHTGFLRFSLSIQLALGIGAFGVCVFVDEGPLNHDHPLFVIHGTIQRITFSLVLLLFPIVQLMLSSDLHKHPMKNIAQMGMSCIRMTDILMQVDYRNVANLGVGWTVLTAAELVSLFLHFANFTQCAILLDLGFNRLPNFEFVEETQEAEIRQSQSGNSLDSTEGNSKTSANNINHSSHPAAYKNGQLATYDAYFSSPD